VPNANCCFLLIFLLCRISIPNEVQMQWNFLEIFLDRRHPGAKNCIGGGLHWRRPLGSTRHQGAPWWVVEPRESFSTDIHLYKYSKIPKTLGESMEHNSSRRKFQNHEIQSRGLFRHSTGGATITEGFFIILVPLWWCVSSLPQTYGSVVSSLMASSLFLNFNTMFSTMFVEIYLM